MPCLKPIQPCPPNPAKRCTASVTLLSHCLVWIENLLLSPYIYGWDIMLNKKLVDIYYLLMMLIISDEGWKAGLFPSGALFHLSHLGPEFRVLCFLMSVPNRVWGAMGPPLSYLPSFVHSSGGPSSFTFATCVCLLDPQLFTNQTRARRT